MVVKPKLGKCVAGNRAVLAASLRNKDKQHGIAPTGQLTVDCEQVHSVHSRGSVTCRMYIAQASLVCNNSCVLSVPKNLDWSMGL